jgi:hypothetical protein
MVNVCVRVCVYVCVYVCLCVVCVWPFAFSLENRIKKLCVA